MADLPHHKVFMVAGEASGDMLGADLVQASHTLNTSHIDFVGVGGTLMEAAGVKLLLNSNSLAVVGALELFKHLNQIRQSLKTIQLYLRKNRPDLLILIDYPGFNLKLAKFAHQINIPVLYYVSPQIWAWHYNRIHKIKKYVTHMAVLFDFEKEMYLTEKVPVTWVGHPLLDKIVPSDDPLKLAEIYHINPVFPTIALIPGSRRQEIQKLLPVILEAATKIRGKFPKAQFILPIANSLDRSWLTNQCPEFIKLASPPLANVLSLCQAAIVTSGTATLETALCQTPLVIIYKTNRFTYWLARWLLKIDKIGLCNIIAGKFVCKEFIQKQANAQTISSEILKILEDEAYRSQMIQELKDMRHHLGENGASLRIAKLMAKMLGAESN